MPSDSATDVQDARNALAHRLRELRRQAGLSGKQLADALAWPPSKVSKLENGHQTPVDQDIRAWTDVTGGVNHTEDLMASLHTLQLRHAEWQRQLRGGLRRHQDTISELDAGTQLFRVFEATVVPGLLQTSEYARARLAQSAAMFGLSADVDDAVHARVRRQDILYQQDKRFHFILTEAALRFRLCPDEVMFGQLDRLISLSSLPTVRLGIIGFRTEYAVAPWHGFWLLDRDQVMVETFSAELNLTQPQEVDQYGRVFDSLASVASYGRDARSIITRVIDDLAAGSQETSE